MMMVAGQTGRGAVGMESVMDLRTVLEVNAIEFDQY